MLFFRKSLGRNFPHLDSPDVDGGGQRPDETAFVVHHLAHGGIGAHTHTTTAFNRHGERLGSMSDHVDRVPRNWSEGDSHTIVRSRMGASFHHDDDDDGEAFPQPDDIHHARLLVEENPERVSEPVCIGGKRHPYHTLGSMASQELHKSQDDAGERKSPPKGYPKSKSQYADPSHWSFPIDAKHIRPAIAYYNAGKHRNKHSPAEWAAIGHRIASAASRLLGKRYILKDGDVVPAEEVKKAMEAPSVDNDHSLLFVFNPKRLA